MLNIELKFKPKIHNSSIDLEDKYDSGFVRNSVEEKTNEFLNIWEH